MEGVCMAGGCGNLRRGSLVDKTASSAVLAPVTEQIPQPQTMPVVAVSQVAPQVAQPELQVDEPQKTPVNGGVADLYASTPALAPASAPIVAAAATEPEPERATPPAEPIAALDVNAMTRAAEEALAERPVVHHAIPLIGDLNQNAKDEIPSLFFTSHRWDSLAGDREVVINGNTYREGDLVKPGLRLTEILEDSIVLDYRGTQFRLGSLNSWVNL